MEAKYLCKLMSGGYLIDSIGKCVGKRRHATRFGTKEELFIAAEYFAKRRQSVIFDDVSFVVIEIHTFPAIPNPNKQ